MIQFKDVSFTYTGETDVLSHINFTIPDGQFVCVLGANGSGKSTLSKLINALLLPDSGEVYTLGLDTADPDNLYVRSPAVKNNVLPLQAFLLWIPKFSFLMRQAPCLIPAVDEGLCACAKNFMNVA